jgi:cytochrome c-type biogenesis protein CcmF
VVFLASGVVWEISRALRSLMTKYSVAGAVFGLFRHDANRRRYGGYLTHLDFGVICAGIIGSSAFVVERPLRMDVGETVEAGRWAFTLVREPDVRDEEGYQAVVATVRLERDGEKKGVLFPERRMYARQEQPTTEPAIALPRAWSSAGWLLHDVYLILEQHGQASRGPRAGLPAAPVSMRLWINPMVHWIWKGTAFLVLAVFLCYLPQEFVDFLVRAFGGARARQTDQLPAGASARTSVQSRREEP